MRVLADSHAIVWHLQGSGRLSAAAANALAGRAPGHTRVLARAQPPADRHRRRGRHHLDCPRFAHRPVGSLYRGDCPSIGPAAGHQRPRHPRERARADHLVSGPTGLEPGDQRLPASGTTRYRPLPRHSNRGVLPPLPDARQFLIDDQDTGSPASSSAARWIVRACIGPSAAFKTATTVATSQPSDRRAW